ncbi:MAG: hypothetical protein AAGD22_11115 [Verrucomicrobiota bacterium]
MRTPIAICFAAFAAATSLYLALTPPQARADIEQHSLRDLVVHEWGTFTSVAGSNGVLLPGLEREEEALPYFVYSHQGMGPLGRKGFNAQRKIYNATIKMETPVLYFYHEKAIDFSVDVRFEGGSISQWYPQRSGGETPPPTLIDSDGPENLVGGEIDFGKNPYQGAISWNFRSLGRGEANNASVLKQGETLNWIRPRGPDSNILENQAENATHEKEKYLFYRGVGNFPLPISTRFDPKNPETLLVESTIDIPFALVFHMDRNQRGKVLWSGALNFETPQAEVCVPEDNSNTRQTLDLALAAFAPLKNALVEAGLTNVEADSMLRTWWTSYFQKPGLRVLWIVPRPFTDEILPIDINPRPTQLERVLIGRSEVLSPAFEKELIAAFSLENQDENQYLHHPLASAYKARITALKN